MNSLFFNFSDRPEPTPIILFMIGFTAVAFFKFGRSCRRVKLIFGTCLIATVISAKGSDGSQASLTKLSNFGTPPANPGPGLDGTLVNFVWKPGTFVLPAGSKNNVLSGVFNSAEDYVYGFELDNDGIGTTPITNFTASNPDRAIINAIGWIADSVLDITTKDIRFQNLASGIDVSRAMPAAPGLLPRVQYDFVDPIPPQGMPLPLRSDVFYFSSPFEPIITSGTIFGPGIQTAVDHYAPKLEIFEPLSLVHSTVGLLILLVPTARHWQHCARAPR